MNRQGREYENEKLIKRKGTKGSYRYDISLKGIEKVQNELRRSSSPIAYFSAGYDLEDIAGIHSDFMTGSARSRAEAWKPLPIDRNENSFKEMRASVIEAIKTIEGDNGLAAHFPEERNGVLQTLRDGLEWITSKSPTRAQLQASLIAPLTWIITRFGEGVMGEAAKKAAEKIFSWLSGL
jgi:hypothetical protein